MRKIFLLLFAAGMLATGSSSFGQLLPCGTPEVDVSSSDDQAFAIAARSYTRKTNAPVRVIPVVFHIISPTSTDPANISQSQIASGITILNNAFRGVYGGVDTEIEFCLSGVNRIENSSFAVVQLLFNDDLAKALSQEDPYLYLNVWTVDALYNEFNEIIGGFTVYPKFLSTFPQLDGVLIDHRFVGDIGTATVNGVFEEGKGLVHEVGHWLNLFHTFQGGCDNGWTCATQGDCCCDTPPQLEANFGCRKRKNSCHDDYPDERDPAHNYMGYTDDDCRTEFTACQKTRMHLTLDSIREYAWHVQGDDCPQVRLGDFGVMSGEPVVRIYPNPIEAGSRIQLELGREALVSIVVHDLQGRIVRRVTEPVQLPGGNHAFPFPEMAGPGQYFVRVQLGGKVLVKAVRVF